MRQRACGIVIRDDHLLMVRHVHGEHDYWTFPGGGIEEDETIFEAAKREVEEETGISLEPLDHIHTFHIEGHETHCVLMTTPPGHVEPTLGLDPEESHLPEHQRMLRDAAWRLIEEVVHHPVIASVVEKARSK